MKRIFAWAACTWFAAACHGQGIGQMADVRVIDRDSGTSLSMTYYRGEYWVAGRPGARYAIEIRNHEGGRMLAVTSVDGINVLSGETAAWNQSGYVFTPGERYQISGWRKSDSQVAAFVFTASPNSYAERTGRPANIGVIGIALFKERSQLPAYIPPEFDSKRSESLLAGKRSAPVASPTPLAPKLGTGHGEREDSFVARTQFERLQSEPNEVIRIHYDSMENLLAMGVLRRPHLQPNEANPFPDSPGLSYVPDPPG
jgi:hypothetical protein